MENSREKLPSYETRAQDQRTRRLNKELGLSDSNVRLCLQGFVSGAAGACHFGRQTGAAVKSGLETGMAVKSGCETGMAVKSGYGREILKT